MSWLAWVGNIITFLVGLVLVGLRFAGFVSKVLNWFADRRVAAQERAQLEGERQIRAAVAEAPRCSIKDAQAEEVATLEGRILSNGDLLRSPFGKRKCVSYEIIVEKLTGERGKYWHEIVSEKKAVDFFLQDDTGRARVDTSALELDIDFDLVIDSATPELEAALAKYGITYQKWRLEGGLRCKERALGPHEVITVCGRMKWEPDPAAAMTGGGYREVPKRLAVEPAPEGFVLVTERRIVHEHDDE